MAQLDTRSATAPGTAGVPGARTPADDPRLDAVVLQRVDFAPDLMILRVAPVGWELPEFTPGQYTLLGLPGSASRAPGSVPEDPPPDPDELLRRAYSIASSSVEREYVEFYVAHVRSGTLTPRLFALRVGDRLHLSRKFTGMFTLDKVPADNHLVFIGTGTGLAPYMSMIRTHVETVRDRRVLVVHGARNSWDLGYRTELFYLQRYAPNFSYVPVLDFPQDEVVPWAGHVGYAQDLWRAGIVGQSWGFEPTPENCHVFLCGNPLMIAAMKGVLAEGGWTLHRRNAPGQVHVEEF